MTLKDTASRFAAAGVCISVEPYGSGLINRTYVAVYDEDGTRVRYIIQRINDKIFLDVPRLMDNIVKVTALAREQILRRGGNPDRETLTVVPARDGMPYVKTDDGYYRMYVFIEGATTYQRVEKPEHFFESGRQLAQFEKELAGFAAEDLFESIPDFHNTVKRFEALERAIEADAVGRGREVGAEIQFALSHRGITDSIVGALERGEIPYRVTHNDTKFNNIMIDDVTGHAVCLIDLDTVMPGSALYDFGDAIRSGCNPRTENEKDLSTVIFDLPLFERYTAGYLSVAKDFLTPAETELLPLSAIMMTFECGIRFLADYLQGDVYFHTTYADENLDRARTQFKLVADMEEHFGEMKKIVAANAER